MKAAGQVIPFVFLFCTASALAAPADLADEAAAIEAPTRFINDALRKAWKEQNLTPSERTSDGEFIRRVTIDLVGRVPTAGEIEVFENGKLPGKRARLVHRLLKSDEFSSYWASVWTVWLLTRAAPPVYQERMRGWLEKEFKRGASHREIATSIVTATGKSSDNGAAAFLLYFRGQRLTHDKKGEEGQFDMIPATWRATRLFAGADANCIRCHNHPFNPDLKQRNFWGLNVFFRQTEFEGADRPAPGLPDFRIADNPKLNPLGITIYQTRRAVLHATRSMYVDGKKLDPKSRKTRRQQFAGLLTNEEHFAQAYVNRMWGYFFGRGLTMNPPVDDLGEHNKPVLPELFNGLAREFARSGHDPRKLMGWICNSDAYQLHVASNKTNDKEEAEPYFTRMLLKPMTPEQLFNSAWTATHGRADARKRAQLYDEWVKALLVEGFDDTWDNSCVDSRGTVEPTLATLVTLLNEPGFQEAEDAKASIEKVYLTVLNRRPTAREVERIKKELDAAGKAEMRDEVLRDLRWALLNSSEFFFNH
jgi:hypothetical protein